MNRIDKKFSGLRKRGEKAFIAYITAGYPNLPATEKIIHILEDAGVDIIELGMPFSDPMADGLTIQRASEHSLRQGTTLKKVLKLVSRVRKKSAIPLVLMSYLNPVYNYGVRKFIDEAALAGLDGAIFPDLPPEEAGMFREVIKRRDFCLIFLASSASTPHRWKAIARASRGFVYYISLMGVTGARQKLPPDIYENVKRIKRITTKPVCVGFGVSNPRQAGKVADVADGVIVGSAIVNEISGGLGKKGGARLNKFVSAMTKAVKKRKPR